MNAERPQKDSGLNGNRTPFEEFLLAEYHNIAHAHFNTVESLSNFIKHYIAIASIPLAVAALFFETDKVSAAELPSILRDNLGLIAILLSALSVIGICVLGYVINIRFDAILYARTVNGIRKHFYDESGLSFGEELRIRALPRTPSLPKYSGNRYFGFVVATFMLVGTSYFGAGVFLYWSSASAPMGWLALPIVSFASVTFRR